MSHIKLGLLIGCLLAGNSILICHDVTTLSPFGTSKTEIAENIKSLVAQKQTLIDALNLYFDKQEREILTKLCAKYNISDKESAWQELFEELVSNDPLFTPKSQQIIDDPNDHAVVKKTRELIQTYNMNPEAITIEDTKTTTAATSTTIKEGILRHKLFLDFSELETLPDQQVTAIIQHELMHLWYSDSLKTLIYSCFIENKKQCDIELDPLYADYLKNAEIRADVMATFHSTDSLLALMSYFATISWTEKLNQNNKSYLQEFTNWLKKKLGMQKIKYPDDHPTCSERVDMLKQLLSYLNEEKKHTASAA